ncbi:hypothetical protein PHYBLDRAFT_174248 [Phycomyces blakesleeanus NRRL 1555(-)]|uniref:Uncharacterized protein n=1 Tax=Phycomyces blakesleeanus (strain ATCC 8743b / DSM 1359 / FGSC 10004 / NBRC 33097 / NRRL 1555) TaxID=763407 RepID=A0A167K9T0_PHYB8|nr:hypothetical protein PHYBLDRAFT_174248 [Phycomyces blakesleeanus NRRL 1555(-)]OAD67558.1 hypothetical protein PHYBLDRAFT_174248 [Phycomyces blakesleeanus NRRL 1555(-)]|eukprot:XP_018285598.1 hypothetical protein PHYBLDRAFT_174248 [Phycomyces blakesleeanus NRRL 1555(-)]
MTGEVVSVKVRKHREKKTYTKAINTAGKKEYSSYCSKHEDIMLVHALFFAVVFKSVNNKIVISNILIVIAFSTIKVTNATIVTTFVMSPVFYTNLYTVKCWLKIFSRKIS